jgi:cytochrome c-type biogenesis protein
MSDLKAPNPVTTGSGTRIFRKFTPVQLLIIGLAGLVVVFLVLGTLNQSSAPPNQFPLGVQPQPFTTLALLAFMGGLLSFVSPCTLPVLTAYFAFAFQSDRQKIAANTMAFMLGLATTFSILGAVGFVLGRVLLQNQSLIMLVGGSAIVIFGVMSLLGRGFSGATSLATQERSTGMGGSYLFGLTFAVGWSACVGPILGVILTLAFQTSTVWQGMMLLFIYTLGLGLPLIIISTFFGRMSRQSAFWRMLRGKGWDWDTSVFIVALIWALALWRIIAAFAEYAIDNFAFLSGMEYSLALEIGILVLLVLGAALWTYTSSEARRVTVHLHTTQLISGALFIFLGLLMLESQMGLINGLLANWSAVVDERTLNFQDWLLTAFNR